MCGIFGVYDFRGYSSKEAINLIERSWSSLRHRGPDGHGAFLRSKSRNQQVHYDAPRDIFEDVELVFTHSRLAIIDLTSDGSQPMADQYNRYAITFNGEIYNFKELRSALMSDGVRFRTNTDTEVIIEAWRKWGVDAVERLNGMFAFALFDSVSEELFLVRDRVGIKPLYYTRTKNGIAFASEQLTLLKTGVVQFCPNWDGVVCGMMFQGSLRPNTVYRGICELKPGHYLRFNKKQFECRKYWDLKIEPNYAESDEIVKKAQSLLAQAVQRTLVSDVPIASLLSGGLDSAVMVNEINKYAKDVSAYTLVWDDELGRDSEYAAASHLASQIGVKHYKCEVSLTSFAENFTNMLDTFQEPMGLFEPHFPVASSMSENRVKVVLAGLGPDEMLGGYGHYRYLGSWIKSAPLRTMFKPPKLSGTRVNKLLRFLLAPTIADAYVTLFNGYLWNDPLEIFSPDTLPSGWDPHIQVRDSFPAAWDQIKDPLMVFNYLDLKVYIGTHHNLTTDLFLMSQGIEGRFPFLDHIWLEYLYNLPSEFKVAGKHKKILMKILASSFLSESQLNSKKIGFGVPELAIVSNAGVYKKMKEMCLELTESPFINHKTLFSVLNSPLRTRRDARKLIYLASLSRWLNRNYEK